MKRGLSPEAGSVRRGRCGSPSSATEGFPTGCRTREGSLGPMSGRDGGSSGSGSGESSVWGSERSATSSWVAASVDSGCAANSATTILVIRMPEEAFRDVADPGESGAAPVSGPASEDGVIAREKTKAWIMIDAAMEATMTRRLSLRCVSTLVPSAAGVTACRSSSGTMLAPGHASPAGCLTPSVRCDSSLWRGGCRGCHVTPSTRPEERDADRGHDREEQVERPPHLHEVHEAVSAPASRSSRWSCSRTG